MHFFPYLSQQDPRFNLANDQTSKIRTVLSVPIGNHRGEVCVPLQIPLTNVNVLWIFQWHIVHCHNRILNIDWMKIKRFLFLNRF